MTTIRLCLLVLALSVLGPVAAQSQPQAIEQQMSEEEFRAAGLDKLSAQELGRLNAWLQQRQARSAAAAPDARRGDGASRERMFGSGGGVAFEATLVGNFDGFERGRRYTLDNGQVWQQVDDARMHGVRLQGPRVRLKPAVFGNVWYLQVDGRAVHAKVRRIK